LGGRASPAGVAGPAGPPAGHGGGAGREGDPLPAERTADCGVRGYPRSGWRICGLGGGMRIGDASISEYGLRDAEPAGPANPQSAIRNPQSENRQFWAAVGIGLLFIAGVNLAIRHTELVVGRYVSGGVPPVAA